MKKRRVVIKRERKREERKRGGKGNERGIGNSSGRILGKEVKRRKLVEVKLHSFALVWKCV